MNKVYGPNAQKGKGLVYRVVAPDGATATVVEKPFKAEEYKGDPGDHHAIKELGEKTSRDRVKYFADIKERLQSMKLGAPVAPAAKAKK